MKITLIISQDQLDEILDAMDRHQDGDISDFSDALTMAAIEFEKSEGECDTFDLTGK